MTKQQVRLRQKKEKNRCKENCQRAKIQMSTSAIALNSPTAGHNGGYWAEELSTDGDDERDDAVCPNDKDEGDDADADAG